MTNTNLKMSNSVQISEQEFQMEQFEINQNKEYEKEDLLMQGSP